MNKLSQPITGRNALVVEGGAVRSIFSAGILDRFLQEQFDPFDFYIGVSAGASNLAFFLSGLQGKAYQGFLNSVQNPQFINPVRFLLGGDLIDMDWLFNSHIIRELEKLLSSDSETEFYIGMTEVATGRNEYHRGMNAELFSALKASMSLPLLYRDFPAYQGRQMTDGGIANGIPVDEAIRLGAENIMVIRSRYKDYQKTDSLFHQFIRYKLKKYPALVALMEQRVSIHDETKNLIAKPPTGISIVDVYPPKEFSMGRFCKQKSKIDYGYHLGQQLAEQAIMKWSSIINAESM
jgi:predicted patatin/cPLA2 family phospholipase